MAPLLALTMLLSPMAPLQDQAIHEWNLKVIENGGMTVDLIEEYLSLKDLFEPEEVIPDRPAVPERSYVASPPPATYTAGVEQWRGLVEAYFAPADVPWALRVMACESRGNPSAQNSRSSAGGLFQFVDATWAATPYAHLSKYDPEANIAAAAWLLRGVSWGGPQHWVCK